MAPLRPACQQLQRPPQVLQLALQSVNHVKVCPSIPRRADASQADLHDHNQMQVLHAKLACIPVATERANAVKTLSFL